MVIKANNIHFSYSSNNKKNTDDNNNFNWTINDLSVDTQPGVITALVGPNASGKTTLLRLLLGVIVPNKGNVILTESGTMSIIHKLKPALRARKIAYVAQRPVVSSPLTVKQVINLGRFQTGKSKEAVNLAMQRCLVSSQADSIYQHLSVGQQQRVSLARALAQLDSDEPDNNKTLLLDEPMSAMDPRYTLETAKLLRQIADTGVSVITVLHDLPLISQLADLVWLLHDGRLVAEGTTRQTLSPENLERVFGIKFDIINNIPHPVHAILPQ